MENTKIETEQLHNMVLMNGQEPSGNDLLLLEIIYGLTELKKVDKEDYKYCLNLLSGGA